jgi:predicted nuclease with TOPRIM domain
MKELETAAMPIAHANVKVFSALPGGEITSRIYLSAKTVARLHDEIRKIEAGLEERRKRMENLNKEIASLNDDFMRQEHFYAEDTRVAKDLRAIIENHIEAIS